jgi:hypothetical protein
MVYSMMLSLSGRGLVTSVTRAETIHDRRTTQHVPIAGARLCV